MKMMNVMAGLACLASVLMTGCCSCRMTSGDCPCKADAVPMGETVAKDDPVYVLCRFDLQPGKKEAYAEAVRTITDAVRRDKGCRFYSLVGDAETDMTNPMKFGPDVLWMVECWDSVDALKAHLQAPHMKKFAPSARPLRKSGTFHVLKELK